MFLLDVLARLADDMKFHAALGSRPDGDPADLQLAASLAVEFRRECAKRLFEREIVLKAPKNELV